MKITAVKTYIVPSEISATSWGRGAAWVLVKLETDAGIVGWGQAYTSHEREYAMTLEVKKLSRSMDGMDPFCIKHFVTSAHDSIGDPQDGLEISSAAAGIEIALWDIVGKALETPVHRLLGGPCRDRIDVYANCWSDESRSPDQLASFAAQQVETGFKAVKLYPFLYGNSVDDGIACLRAVRDAVGPDVSIFVDMWERMRPEDLPRIIAALHAHKVPWFEDPANANDVDSLARIRAQSKLPVVTGETLYSKQEFLRLLDHKAADILNPDITRCGILGTKEIAAIAEPFPATVSVHNNNTMTIGLAAAMQAAAVIPNFALVEHFPRFVEGSNSFSSFPCKLDEDGCIPLSHEPGIGVEVDDAAVAAMEYKPDLDD
ncbi:MAG: mandelate racemase/muconate lactonizing enzyme family protein [Alphaproteobacteria bacterium]